MCCYLCLAISFFEIQFQLALGYVREVSTCSCRVDIPSWTFEEEAEGYGAFNHREYIWQRFYNILQVQKVFI